MYVCVCAKKSVYVTKRVCVAKRESVCEGVCGCVRARFGAGVEIFFRYQG